MKNLPNQIVLIGMSGVGKSSIGKQVAQKIQYNFIDTDTYIQTHINQPIQLYIQQNSETAFLELEEKTILSIPLKTKTLIATGGSVIYSTNIMSKFKKTTTIIHIQDSLDNICKRIPSFQKRGLIKRSHKSLKNLFTERENLYKQYAELTLKVNYPFNLENETAELIQLLLQ